jgi:hypothetical protein
MLRASQQLAPIWQLEIPVESFACSLDTPVVAEHDGQVAGDGVCNLRLRNVVSLYLEPESLRKHNVAVVLRRNKRP